MPTVKVVLGKAASALLTLAGATLLLFVLIRLAPGDPVEKLLGHSFEASIDAGAYEERAAELRAQLGLDQSAAVQYVAWLKRVVQLDLGASIHTGRAVGEEIAARLPATLALSLCALAIQLAAGLMFGLWAALRAGRLADQLIRIGSVSVASMPAFAVSLALLALFAVKAGWYTIEQQASAARLWLPAATLGLLGAPQFARIVRAHLLEEFGKTYVVSALARGLARRRIVRHALRNALLPLATMISLSFASLIGGAVVIESIFSWPGIGSYALDSVLLKDYPVIQGYALVTVSLVIGIHLLTDLAYALIDPRLHRKGGTALEPNV